MRKAETESQRRERMTRGAMAMLRRAQAARGTRQQPTAEQRARDKGLIDAAAKGRGER